MVATASIKMDELLASWLGSDGIYESVLRIIETQKAEMATSGGVNTEGDGKHPAGTGTANQGHRPPLSPKPIGPNQTKKKLEIPPFFHRRRRRRHPSRPSSSSDWNYSSDDNDDETTGASDAESLRGDLSFLDDDDNDDGNPQLPSPPKRRTSSSFSSDQTWDGIYSSPSAAMENSDGDDERDARSFATDPTVAGSAGPPPPCIAVRAQALFLELGVLPPLVNASSSSSSSSSSFSQLDPADTAHLPAILSTHHQSNVYHLTHDDLRYIPVERFEKLTKELCQFPSFFHKPLYRRILNEWERYLSGDEFRRDNERYEREMMMRRRRATETKTDTKEGHGGNFFRRTPWQVGTQQSQPQPQTDEPLPERLRQPFPHPLPTPPVVTYGMFHRYWIKELAPHDRDARFFRLLKQPTKDHVTRDDFFPYIKELLDDHPGLEFLSNHAEFQDKYAVTVITRIFYSVNLCHSGRITARQIRKSDLLSVFHQVDEEEDINKVTKYFSYEHFYVLYCRFWELDNDRDYRITRDDLLKYGDHCLSHMIVDRIFDAAPRPFEGNDKVELDDQGNVIRKVSREYLSYEDFIFFMLSEEDKANEVSVRYWFQCVDVDGDDKLNNMEMRSFYAVQLHRMQCMGHEVVPFEDMLCQMMDMIKPASTEYLVVEDFLRPHCSQVSGTLFDALFNVNKYVHFEQRDPFSERQKREDDFETDWDRFACFDYNRLAMEEEQREEEALEVEWQNPDDDDDEYNSMGMSGSSEAPF